MLAVFGGEQFKHRRPVDPPILNFSPVLPTNSCVVMFNEPLKPSHDVKGNIQQSPSREWRLSQWVVDNWIEQQFCNKLNMGGQQEESFS